MWEKGDATFLVRRGGGGGIVLGRATGGRRGRCIHYRSNGPAVRPDTRVGHAGPGQPRPKPLAGRRALRRHALRGIEPRHPGSNRRRNGPEAVVENGRAARSSQPSPRRISRPGCHRQRFHAVRLESLYRRSPLPNQGRRRSRRRTCPEQQEGLRADGQRHDHGLSPGADHGRRRSSTSSIPRPRT